VTLVSPALALDMAGHQQRLFRLAFVEMGSTDSKLMTLTAGGGFNFFEHILINPCD